LLGNKIIGVTCHNSIKLAKTAVKNKADYLAFGAFFSTKTKKVKYKATIKILNKAKKLFKTPLLLLEA
jgi:thiamine-phosphate pyrophosphorylase